MNRFALFLKKAFYYILPAIADAINGGIDFVNKFKEYQPLEQDGQILFDETESDAVIAVAKEFGFKFKASVDTTELQQAGEWAGKISAMRQSAFYAKLAAYRSASLGAQDLPTALLDGLVSIYYHFRKLN